MSLKEKFLEEINTKYTFKGVSLLLGTAMFERTAIPNAHVKIPLKTINRHGLISGATGTGKTKTLQNIVERLSEKGVSVLLMDVKGDLSGLAKPGNDHPKIQERHALIGIPWKARGYPVELFSISEEKGVRLRATISEFGPILLSKILDLNDNQQGIVALVFKYCDDNQLPLLDIKDFRKALHYLSNEGKDKIKEKYGRISPSSAGVILRKLIEIEEQDADLFFGEMSFDVNDLMRIDENGFGYVNALRLIDIQDRPKLFSTFMLCLLAEIYEKFPEIGDKEAPELVIFIDEAHLIFDEASKPLLEQIETIIKLIRSKGVGIIFCTQSPSDVPDSVLAQLGLKVQHALRAFTAKDRKDIKSVSENFPETEYYEIDKIITEFGIGEALITALNEKGIPTPLVHTLLTAPSSRMDILTGAELEELISASRMISKYNETIDRESAYEILTKKLEEAAKEESKKVQQKKVTSGRREKSTIEKVSSNPLVKTVFREVTRGLLGVLGMSGSRRRRRK